MNLGLYLLEIEITITEIFNNFPTSPSATFDYGKPGFNCILSFPMELCQSYNHLVSSDLFMHITRLPPAKCPFKTPAEIQDLTTASISSSFSILEFLIIFVRPAIRTATTEWDISARCKLIWTFIRQLFHVYNLHCYATCLDINLLSYNMIDLSCEISNMPVFSTMHNPNNR